jgi:hypothetical protein
MAVFTQQTLVQVLIKPGQGFVFSSQADATAYLAAAKKGIYFEGNKGPKARRGYVFNST